MTEQARKETAMSKKFLCDFIYCLFPSYGIRRSWKLARITL